MKVIWGKIYDMIWYDMIKKKNDVKWRRVSYK